MHKPEIFIYKANDIQLTFILMQWNQNNIPVLLSIIAELKG